MQLIAVPIAPAQSLNLTSPQPSERGKRLELRKLTERKQYHEELRQRYEGELREVGDRIVAKRNAVAVAKDNVKVQPRLRHDIAALTEEIEKLDEQAADLRKEVKKHAASSREPRS